MTDNTEFKNKAAILAKLWTDFKNDPNFEDFFTYNDLGLPLAYALDNDIIVANDRTHAFIDETFELLLAGLELEDTGFETLNDVLTEAE